MRILRAFAWLRWRVLMNSLERTGARDTVERFSLAIEQLGPIMAAVLMIPSAILLAGAGGYSGWALAAGNPQPLPFEALRFLLLAACALTIIGPLLLPAGERTNAVRLLLLPISRPMLYVAQAATIFTDPWIALVVPVVIALPVGLAIGGAWGVSLVAAAAGLLLLLALIGIASIASSLIHLIVRDRRRGELITLVFILILPMVGLLPGLMSATDGKSRATQQAERRAGRSRPKPAWITTVERRALPMVPSEMFVRATRAAARGQATPAGRALAVLALASAILHTAGLFVFGRVLDSPGATGSRRRATDASARAWRIPGASRPTSAIAVNQIRLAFRTPRGRSILLSPVVVFMMFGVMMWRSGANAELGFLTLGSGIGLALFGSWVSFLAVLPMAMNQFSIDRAGLTLVFLSPIDDRELLWGKALGNGIIAGVPTLFCILGAAVLFRAGPLGLWLALPLGAVASYLLVAPLAAALSALFPRPVDLNSIGRGSNAHGVAGFVGFLGFTAAGALSVGLALLSLHAFGEPGWTPLIMGIWCAICAVLGRVLFVPVRALLGRRRENLALVR